MFQYGANFVCAFPAWLAGARLLWLSNRTAHSYAIFLRTTMSIAPKSFLVNIHRKIIKNPHFRRGCEQFEQFCADAAHHGVPAPKVSAVPTAWLAAQAKRAWLALFAKYFRLLLHAPLNTLFNRGVNSCGRDTGRTSVTGLSSAKYTHGQLLSLSMCS